MRKHGFSFGFGYPAVSAAGRFIIISQDKKTESAAGEPPSLKFSLRKGVKQTEVRGLPPSALGSSGEGGHRGYLFSGRKSACRLKKSAIVTWRNEYFVTAAYPCLSPHR